MQNKEVPELDVKTLEYVCAMIESDYDNYLELMERAKGKEVERIFLHKSRAVDKIDRELHWLIYGIKMKQGGY